MAKIIRAVAGILCRDNKVLISSRPYGKSYEGCWEFPGGKIEDGETVADALIRELNEEIGVTVKCGDLRNFIYLKQPYTTANVHLDVMWVHDWENEPVAVESQQLFWQPVHEFCKKSPLLLTTQKILDILKEK
ncbi:MAG: (deoxy)nucleoside triphosphate pyrophosphohydrolase [Neisseriaceae bacterium]|jgi:8-oxo-dGTP diphosphatase